MKIFNKFLLSALFYIGCASQLIADVAGHERAFTEHSVYSQGAKNIKVTFLYTGEVDTCNSFLLQGEVHDVSDIPHYYVADLRLMGTMMYCNDRTMIEQTFILEKEFPGDSMTILVPANIRVFFKPSAT